ncbi:acetylornithine aminotransferase [Spirochaetota bacterium]|nr:acetylornithine aminotransferase [Spirochaetota bacterium]
MSKYGDASILLSRFDNRPKMVMQRGEGVYFYDTKGIRYLDLMSGWGCNCLGANPSVLKEAVETQLHLLTHTGPLVLSDKMFEFGHNLLQATTLDRIFFTSTGAEANENAIKVARKYGSVKLDGAYEVITFSNGFHGRTLAMMSASARPGWDKKFMPKVPGFVHVPWNDLNAVEAAIKNHRIAAIFLELIQGEGGVNVAEQHFIAGLRELAARHKILIMVDEVQTGMGRTGQLFAHNHFDFVPDVLTMAKSIGGGFPLGAIMTKEHCALFENNEVGATYSGQAIMMAVGIAILKEMLKPSFLPRVMAMGDLFKETLKDLAGEGLPITHIRGKGLMIAFDVKEDLAPVIAKQAMSFDPKGINLIINSVRPNSIRMLPPLIIQPQHIAQFKETFRSVYQTVLAH